MRKIVRFNMVNGLLIDAVNCGEIAEIPENTQISNDDLNDVIEDICQDYKEIDAKKSVE